MLYLWAGAKTIKYNGCLIPKRDVTVGALRATSPDKEFRLCATAGTKRASGFLAMVSVCLLFPLYVILAPFSQSSPNNLLKYLSEGKIAVFDSWKFNGIFLNKQFTALVSSVHPAGGLQWGSLVAVRSRATCTYVYGAMDTPCCKCSSALRETAADALLTSGNLWKQAWIEIGRKARQTDISTVGKQHLLCENLWRSLHLRGRIWQMC